MDIVAVERAVADTVPVYFVAYVIASPYNVTVDILPEVKTLYPRML